MTSSPSALLQHFIHHRRPEILLRWKELWNSIQAQRSESVFVFPPFERILDLLPYHPSTSPVFPVEITEWYRNSPIFCSGAVFCQLHASIAHILQREQVPERGLIIEELEHSLEEMQLEVGSQKWIANLMKDGNPEAFQSERLAVIGQLAAGVAHEIGNPLTAISSIVQILQRQTSDAFFLEKLGLVKKSTERIAIIVRELVDFSRPAPSHPIPVPINDMLRTAVNLMKYDSRAKHITFASHTEPDLPMVTIVPDQLLQVFINLIINAIDAMSGSGTITIETQSVDGQVIARISDTGVGIPPELRHRIFDPFFTTKPVGKGTGLGLSVSYGIITRYGGKIEVSSHPGEGSTFSVMLPASVS